MSYWNDTIFANASRFADMDPQTYESVGFLVQFLQSQSCCKLT